MKEELLFYNAYEDFYTMVDKSDCFKRYCLAAFGVDFSQDGFSDINQIKLILKYAPKENNLHILDIGCGNGKMVKYLQQQLGGYIYGFDYSENAINTANADNTLNSDFKTGIIGELNYPSQTFDLIVSMDSIYFVNDMNSFVGQIYRWLKNDGVFFIGYQEGEIMAKTSSSETSVLAEALRKNNFRYDVLDYTEQVYNLLRHKRKTILEFKDGFIKENLFDWYNIILNQTNSADVSYEEFKLHNARYIYIAKK